MTKFRGAAEYKEDLNKRRSRKVMTSAKRDQLALDSGPVAGHSLFTGTLIEGLNWGKADYDGNGIVTGAELSLYIQQQVGQSSDSEQTPDFGEFALDDRGDLVFSLRDSSFDSVKARAFAAIRLGDMDLFREMVEQVIAIDADSPEAQYLAYRRAMHEDDYDTAVKQVRKLMTNQLEKGTIPLADYDLGELNIQLPYWKSLLALPNGGTEANIEVLAGQDKGALQMISTETLDTNPGYRITSGWHYRYRITNVGDANLYIYLLRIDTNGRLRYVTLWEDSDLMINGLQPGASASTYLFGSGSTGINEMRFIASRSMVPKLLAPPQVTARGVLSPFDEIDSMTRQSFFHLVLPQGV
jgi:hypothetical protein